MHERKRYKSIIPRHRLADLTWSSIREARRRLIDTPYCVFCRRRAHKTVADARSYIGLLVRNRLTWVRHEASFTIHPYRCPFQNGYHVGRDLKALRLIEKGLMR